MKNYEDFMSEAKVDLIKASLRLAKKAINPKNIALSKSFVRNARGGFLDKAGRNLGSSLKNFAKVHKPTHKLALVDDPSTLYRRVAHMARRGKSIKQSVQPSAVKQGNALKQLKSIADRMKSPDEKIADYARNQFTDRKLDVIKKRNIRKGLRTYKPID